MHCAERNGIGATKCHVHAVPACDRYISRCINTIILMYLYIKDNKTYIYMYSIHVSLSVRHPQYSVHMSVETFQSPNLGCDLLQFSHQCLREGQAMDASSGLAV